MTKTDTVDVILPTYNGLPWLKSTIQSVINQTHKNLLLYIVDDGSTDNTEKYVKSVKDKRVKYLKKPNGGQATARNYGIKNSWSDFIAFIDSDDIWHPQKLEKQIKIMNTNPKTGMVYGHHYVIDDEDIVQRNLRIWKKGHIFDDLAEGNCIAGSASMVLVRRGVFDSVGVFHEDFLIGEDWEMWLRIASKYRVDFVPEVIASLRERGDGMQKNRKKMADGLLYMYDVMKKELPLNKSQKRKLAYACLRPAADHYLFLGARGKSKITLIKMFKENPASFFARENWPKLTIELYPKALLGIQVVSELFFWIRSKFAGLLRKVKF